MLLLEDKKRMFAHEMIKTSFNLTQACKNLSITRNTGYTYLASPEYKSELKKLQFDDGSIASYNERLMLLSEIARGETTTKIVNSKTGAITELPENGITRIKAMETISKMMGEFTNAQNLTQNNVYNLPVVSIKGSIVETIDEYLKSSREESKDEV